MRKMGMRPDDCTTSSTAGNINDESSLGPHVCWMRANLRSTNGIGAFLLTILPSGCASISSSITMAPWRVGSGQGNRTMDKEISVGVTPLPLPQLQSFTNRTFFQWRKAVTHT